MRKARIGDTVVVEFSGLMENGTILNAPLVFTIGRGSVIPAVEEAVTGLSPGEETQARIPPEGVFGLYREDLVKEIRVEELPEATGIVGAWLEIVRPDGEVVKGIVREVSSRAVVVDTNHPLAGNHLDFSARLVKILP